MVLFFLFSRKDTGRGLSVMRTQELKGFAILAIIFSHIGYFLVEQHNFLFPLSVFAGVGVNIFLFLSGYGLTVSSLTKKETTFEFYKKRFLKICIPLWVVLVLYISMDFLIKQISYPLTTTALGFFGVFLTADIFQDLNSPLWYVTVILFYYVLFPHMFSRARPWITAIGFLILGQLMIKAQPEFLQHVVELYELHTIAFPLGIFCAWIAISLRTQRTALLEKYIHAIKDVPASIKKILSYSVVVFLVCSIGYLAIYSGVENKPFIEQSLSIITLIFILLLWVIKKYTYQILVLFGVYSYEIYLLHWPILYKYNIFYTYMPAWIGTILYLVLFIGLAIGLRIVSQKILDVLKNRKMIYLNKQNK